MTAYRGRSIDPVALWANYVEFPLNMDDSGPFLPLVRCPNPDHDTMKRHFQINVYLPLVHCFAGCGISGTWEEAIMKIEGVDRNNAHKIILRHSIRPSQAAISAKPVSKRKSRSVLGHADRLSED